MAERTANTLVPWDDSFPQFVVHIASVSRPRDYWLWMRVVYYGLEANQYGSVPVVATDCDTGESWYAGEVTEIDGRPTMVAVNGYADESTALSYVRDRRRVWTLG